MQQSVMKMTDEQDEYLRNHKWAALATGRKDGSPQLSQIAYSWNGSDFAISVKSYTAKWRNARRQPKVALLIHEERRQLVVYGTVRCIDSDPERAELTRRVHEVFFDDLEIGINDEFISVLERDKRMIFLVTPHKLLDEGFAIGPN